MEYPTTTVTTGHCKKQSNRDSQQECEGFAGPKCRYPSAMKMHKLWFNLAQAISKEGVKAKHTTDVGLSSSSSARVTH